MMNTKNLNEEISLKRLKYKEKKEKKINEERSNYKGNQGK